MKYFVDLQYDDIFSIRNLLSDPLYKIIYKPQTFEQFWGHKIVYILWSCQHFILEFFFFLPHLFFALLTLFHGLTVSPLLRLYSAINLLLFLQQIFIP